MQKDFDGWSGEKKKLEVVGHDQLSFHEREIWWCSIGINLGHEQDGKNCFYERPVLVVKKFNRRLAWVVPMSTKQKEGIYYYLLKHDNIVFTVILSQFRLVSVKRFRRFIRKISLAEFVDIKSKIIALLEK